MTNYNVGFDSDLITYQVTLASNEDPIVIQVDLFGTSSGGGGGAVDSVFGRTGNVIANSGDYTTDQITEATNLYYTEARVSANSDVVANTAKVSFPEAPNDGNQYARQNEGWTQVTGGSTVDSVNGQTGVVVLDTDDISEGTNKYYSSSLFDSDLASKTTTDLTEGTNLYYTEARVSANSDVVANTAKVGVTTQISNLVEDTSPQLGGNLDINGKTITTQQTAGENLVLGDLCYLDSNNKYVKTDASAESTSKGHLLLAAETIAADAVGTFFVYGET